MNAISSTTGIRAVPALPLECWNEAIIRGTGQPLNQRD
jgi:hypothetical protein